VIGAASLVRGTLPEFCIAFGVPAVVRGWRGHAGTGVPAALVTATPTRPDDDG
jgi:acetyltransferase-like isoleucine patch superfamily enzyme